jgi:hypothetical protein
MLECWARVVLDAVVGIRKVLLIYGRIVAVCARTYSYVTAQLRCISSASERCFSQVSLRILYWRNRFEPIELWSDIFFLALIKCKFGMVHGL